MHGSISFMEKKDLLFSLADRKIFYIREQTIHGDLISIFLNRITKSFQNIRTQRQYISLLAQAKHFLSHSGPGIRHILLVQLFLSHSISCMQKISVHL